MKTEDYKEIGREDILALFPKIRKDANKGTLGRVLCICGSYSENGGMCGAAYFAAMAAYRCGAGIVEIFTARENYAPLVSLVPEAVFSFYGKDAEETLSFLPEKIKKADSVVLGCGLGKSELSRLIVRSVLENADKPLVIDADALNIISEDKSLLKQLFDAGRRKTVITPHPLEMMRLSGIGVEEINQNRVEVAQNFARKHGIVCLLKGYGTIITDGDEVYINRSGNAGMATAGMGDVLAGIIGALLARDSIDSCHSERMGSNPTLYRAAVGAYLHGLAGDIAADEVGEYSLVSSDVISHLGQAIKGK